MEEKSVPGKQDLQQLQDKLRKEEAFRKVQYAESELALIKRSAAMDAQLTFIELIKKYGITADDARTILEIAPNL
jgi:hypothetical protein